MKSKSIPPPPRYFTERPKPGCFHAVEFGTHYTPRGPIYGACIGTMFNIEERWLEQRIANLKQRGDTEMLIFADGTIIDVITTGNTIDGKTAVTTRPVLHQFPS